MSLDPLFSLDHDGTLDFHRKLISTAADRLSRFSIMVMELIEMREDDQAQAMREACAGQMAAINKGFTDLGRSLKQKPEERAKAYFESIGKGDVHDQERRRVQQLVKDAEAEAERRWDSSSDAAAS